MKRKTKKIILLILALSFLFRGSATLAAEIEILYPNVPGAEPPQIFMEKINSGEYERKQAFPLYLKYVYHLLIFTTGLACFYALVSGGVTYLISGVTTSAVQAKTALDKISAGLMGVGIILSTYIILQVLDPNLLVFEMESPGEITGGDIPAYEEMEVEKDTYVEIPMTGLVQNTKDWGELTFKESTDVWEITSVESEEVSIPQVAECLQILVNTCDCAAEADCEGEKLRCTHDCENPDSGCQPAEDFCEEEVDPCNIEIGNLCAAQGVGTPPNLREAITSTQSLLQFLIKEAREETRELAYAKARLEGAKKNEEVAEALIRDTMNAPLNYQTFAGIEDKNVKEIWSYEKPKTFAYDRVKPPYEPVAPSASMNELKNIAKMAEEATGVRAALILALLNHESGLNKFAGNGNYPDAFCYDQDTFENIWEEVKGLYPQYTIETIPVSGSGIYADVQHCGGAMGPAQAMPATWVWLKETVRQYMIDYAGYGTGDIISPWEYQEAFFVAGLHLKYRGGADSQKCSDEVAAVISYWGAPHGSLQNQIVENANAIAESYGWEKCK